VSAYIIILSFLFLFVGLFILLTNNPVHAILSLVLIFFLSSCLAVALGVEFLAFLILIVYVGAISVLFLFVVMLLNIRVLELNVSLLKYWWVGALYSIFFLSNLWYSISGFFFLEMDSSASFIDLSYQLGGWNSISQFGEVVFLYFPHLLILAALILFVAIVSPVLLTFISFSVGRNRGYVLRRQEIFLQTLRLSVDKNFN
jgi:NADH-quinone oxidoreductase subunit J